MLALAPVTPLNPIITQSDSTAQYWQTYYDPRAALASVIDHIETQPSSRNPERHTMRAYLTSLASYFRYMGADVTHHHGENYAYDFDHLAMPTVSSTNAYIAHLKRTGTKSSSIMRMLAPVRLFISALDDQFTQPRNGNDFMLIMEIQRQFRLISKIKNPKEDVTTNRPALENHGKRLTPIQVNTLFDSFNTMHSHLPDITTLAGKRDLAILYVGITSGLRVAELARLTLHNIEQADNCYLIRVRGKRNNIDPVGIDETAFQLISDYLACLEARTGQPLADHIPLWQNILKGDNLPTQAAPLSTEAIRLIVARRTKSALGFELAAHDMRRTCAYLMRESGYEFDAIRLQLRHQSIATTEKYVGRSYKYNQYLLSNRLNFTLPQDNRLL